MEILKNKIIINDENLTCKGLVTEKGNKNLTKYNSSAF